MMKNKYISVIMAMLMALVVFTSCNNSTTTSSSESDEEDHDHHEVIEGMAVLNKTQREAINLTMGRLTPRIMNGVIKTNGRLKVSPSQKAKITSYVGGNVNSIKVFEGEKVRKGQLLATIVHPDIIKMQQEFLGAYNQLDYLKKELERQKLLFDNEVGSGKNYQKVQADYNALLASYKGKMMQLKLLGFDPERIEKGQIYSSLTIYSPISGYVSDINVSLGKYIDANTEIFTVLNTDDLHADLNVYEKDIAKVREGQRVRLKVTSRSSIELEGVIFALGRELTGDSKTIVAHARLDHIPEGVYVDSYVFGDILTTNQSTLAVPETAIVEDGGKSFIFVLDLKGTAKLEKHDEEEAKEHQHKDGDHDGEEPLEHEENWAFRMVEVIPQFTENGYVAIQILETLPNDVQVVMDGTFYLLSDMKKGEAKHSH
ncbi:MAG: efflux RND transporter periplasmic adaptor subunit [Prolixibacteraceae bacterium]